MNRYEIKTPRAAIGVAAIIMVACTLGAAVILPALTSPDDPQSLIAARKAAAPTEVAISPSHIEVVGTPDREVAAADLTPRLDLIDLRAQATARERGASASAK